MKTISIQKFNEALNVNIQAGTRMQSMIKFAIEMEEKGVKYFTICPMYDRKEALKDMQESGIQGLHAYHVKGTETLAILFNPIKEQFSTNHTAKKAP